MQIIYVGTLPPHRGGSATLAAELLSGLAERGHRITAIAPLDHRGQVDRSGALDARLRTIRFLMTHEETDTSRATVEACRRERTEHFHAHLSRLLKEERSDLLLIGHETFVGRLPQLAAHHGMRCVVQCHGRILYLSEGYSEPTCRELLVELGKADLLVCCARHMAAAVADRGFSRRLAIPNGIDVERFRPVAKPSHWRRDLKLEPDASIALHASNLKPVKRLTDLVDAASILRDRYPQLFHLIVGDGPDRSLVEDACRDRGVADRFRFVGWIDRAHMPDVLGLADMVIMPSASEGLSLTCLEAMACGKLVIASDIPGMREIIQDGRTGLLFRMGDVDDLAAKISHAARDPELRARIGRAARAYVQQHHRLEDMVARYEALLMELVAGASG